MGAAEGHIGFGLSFAEGEREPFPCKSRYSGANIIKIGGNMCLCTLNPMVLSENV